MRNLGEVTDGIHDGSVMGTDIGLAPVDVRFTPQKRTSEVARVTLSVVPQAAWRYSPRSAAT